MRAFAWSGIALVLCAHSAVAQNGPTLGFVFDARQKAIRPIWGIAGSASYGAPLELGIDIDAAAVSDAGRTAAVANATAVFVVTDRAGGPIVVRVNGLNGSPDLLAVAPSGAFAAAYYDQSQTLAIIGPISTGAPQVRTLQAPQIQNAPTALAVSGDGLSAALVVPTRSRSAAEAPARGSGAHAAYTPSGSVLRLDSQSGEVRQVATVVSGTSVAFLPGDNAVVVADPGAGSVFVVRNIDSGPARTDLLARDDRMRAPSSVAVLADAQSVLATADEGSLAILSLRASDPVFLNCACTPASPRRLNGTSAALVSNIRDGVAWMLEWNAAHPRVLFIPPQGQD